MQRVLVFKIATAAIFCAAAAASVLAQEFNKPIQVGPGAKIEIINLSGRVRSSVADTPEVHAEAEKPGGGQIQISATSPSGVSPDDVEINSSSSLVRIKVVPGKTAKRIDISVTTPPHVRLKIETGAGEVLISGEIDSAEVKTETGTIAADVPTDRIRYSLQWTQSRPRFLSDFELEKVKEKAAGRFEISGTYTDEMSEPASDRSADATETTHSSDLAGTNGAGKLQRDSGGDGIKKRSARPLKLDLETARGIILLNIPPGEVTGDLRERPLTNAAKAIIRSGDSLLMEAIRRAAPKHYGDYARTLPPIKLPPSFADGPDRQTIAGSMVKVASVRVSDVENRALADLAATEFEVLENGTARQILSVKPATAPFNLVLLLDVSGSVENYVNFIRKAARSFVNTVDARDRVSIVTFNGDVNVVSKFTTEKKLLSESLDTFDAGGATAYYDALAYTLADTLRPLRGERTAIVILTDGDDNRSFLPFESMLSSIQESGALIYPLYVPSGLIAASQANPNAELDALRTRYLHGELTSKAKGEGGRLASVSGGRYYEISQLSQIQTAYEDIVRQLRTAYEVEYRSELDGPDAGLSPRLRIRTKRPNTYVQVRSVVPQAR